MDPQLPPPQNVVAPQPDESSDSQDSELSSQTQLNQPVVGGNRRSKKWLIIIVILVLVIVGGVTAYILLSKKKAEPPVEQSATQPVEQPSETARCLLATDFNAIYKEINDKERPEEAVYDKPEIPFAQEINFNPDSVEYSSPQSQNEGTITAFGNFVKAFPDKEFEVVITGNVATDKQSELDLAEKRSLKIQNALIEQEVDASRITIAKPQPMTGVNSPSPLTVSLSIDPACKMN